MFVDRERAYDVIQTITGARMHPAFFRIGGVAMDLPTGWDVLVRDFLDWMPKRLDDYEGMVLRNELFQIRTKGVSAYDAQTCMKWGRDRRTSAGCGHGLGYAQAAALFRL